MQASIATGKGMYGFLACTVAHVAAGARGRQVS